MDVKESYTHYKVLFLLFLMLLFFTAYLFPDQQNKINELAGLESTSLDQRFNYNLNDVQILFNDLGIDGLNAYYFVSTTTDLIFPMIYGLFFILILFSLLKKVTPYNSHWRWLSLMPILAVILDYTENILIQNLIKAYPDITESQVSIASHMTQFKWLLAIVILIMIAGLVLLILIKKIKTFN